MPSQKKKTNTLCVVNFIIFILGIGLYCIFKPPPSKEYIQPIPLGSNIRTVITPTNNIREPSVPDDNIELIDAY